MAHPKEAIQTHDNNVWLTLNRKKTRVKSRRPITPVMTMAASAFSGMWRNTGVSHSSTTPINAAFTTPASPALG